MEHEVAIETTQLVTVQLVGSMKPHQWRHRMLPTPQCCPLTFSRSVGLALPSTLPPFPLLEAAPQHWVLCRRALSSGFADCQRLSLVGFLWTHRTSYPGLGCWTLRCCERACGRHWLGCGRVGDRRFPGQLDQQCVLQALPPPTCTGVCCVKSQPF